jgi:hypothetical protein
VGELAALELEGSCEGSIEFEYPAPVKHISLVFGARSAPRHFSLCSIQMDTNQSRGSFGGGREESLLFLLII